jgi:hypothetical protein
MGEELLYAGKMQSAPLIEQADRYAAHAPTKAWPLPDGYRSGFRTFVAFSHNMFSFKEIHDLKKILISVAPSLPSSVC